MNESGLIFCMMSAKSILTSPIKGFKKILTRITLAFNVSLEVEKLMPLVIGNAERPRSLHIKYPSVCGLYTFKEKLDDKHNI
ncbi:hypothetical protein AAJ76_680007860 [Vairimorpha ceranae]|uniref:Uncharacterized protein n=1 Tax=Vairimorpha ceranae TaxID=40302 RepID=A0A0F9YP66_9MICR|nr:hypothetical protein AAJ76_680007860 [Vairimorpha ceranae]KKO74467.1 hypothetical protein AAJ76_680007860 [Vairimorpha ceranae]